MLAGATMTSSSLASYYVLFYIMCSLLFSLLSNLHCLLVVCHNDATMVG